MSEEIKNRGFEIDTDRFICFLDIMGFKDLVARSNHDEVGKILYRLAEVKDQIQAMTYSINDLHDFNPITQKLTDLKRIESVAFSDSILFITKDDSIESLEVMANASRALISFSIGSAIPLKGAIAHGRFSADFDKSIYFGQPLIDAYLLQENLFYYGIVADNSVDKFFLLNDVKGLDFGYIQLPTPFKTGKITHINLDMAAIADADYAQILYGQVSGLPRKYVDNTIEMFNEMRKLR